MSKFTSNKVNLKNFEKGRSEKYKTTSKNSKNLVFTIDAKYKVTSANPDAAKFLGKTAAKLVGISIFELAPEGFLEGQKTNVKDIFRSGDPLVVESWLLVKNHQRYYQTRLEPVIDENGAVSSVLTIASDITESKIDEVLAHTIEKLASTNSIGDMFSDVMKDLNYLIPYDKASIAIANDSEDRFDIYKIDSSKPGQKEKLELAYSETVLHSVYTSGKKLSRQRPSTGRKPKEHDRILKKDKVLSQ